MIFDSMIFHDAINAYSANDAQALIEKLSNPNTLLVVKSAHYFSTAAFNLLFIHFSKHSTPVVFVETDETRVLPPLLDYVKSGQIAA